MTLHYEDGGLRLWHGKNMDVLPSFPDATFDSIVTDPPYELGFMGKGWDSSGIAYDVDVWRECLRVLKPGGFLLAFGGSRTWHRIAVAIEAALLEGMEVDLIELEADHLPLILQRVRKPLQPSMFGDWEVA